MPDAQFPNIKRLAESYREGLEVGELGAEPHPAGRTAVHWLLGLGYPELTTIQEAFASTAIEGNFLAEVCGETLRRLLAREPVSDRYILGLAWTVRDLMETAKDKPMGSVVVKPDEGTPQ